MCSTSTRMRVKRSTYNGAEQTYTVHKATGAEQVPSYVCAPGCSIDQAARILGMRALGRRESEDAAVAEVHERGGRSYLLARLDPT